MEKNMDISLQGALKQYLENIRLARSINTFTTYRNGINLFTRVLGEHNLDVNTLPVNQLHEEAIIWLALALKDYAPTSEQLYLTSAAGFFEYLAAENLAPINLPRIHLLIRQRSRRPGQRLPQFPEKSIDDIIIYMINMTIINHCDQAQQLIDYRDRAFLLTLADTGLRVHEACGLRRGDLDWNEGRALVIGKGNRQDVVRFSTRSLTAIKDYIKLRSSLDGASHRPLSSLPLFARHDRGAGKAVKPITTTTGRNIVTERVIEILGPEAAGSITPHSFRHYFVTRVLKGSGNLKLAQSLARHRNITVTQRYAHLSDDELDQGYMQVFDDNNKPKE
jgi:integrase/recombinase XerC